MSLRPNRISQPPTTGPEAAARHVHRLPCLASELQFENEEAYGWGPTLKTILEGTRDIRSPLYALRGFEPALVKHIYDFVNFRGWAKYVTLTIPASCVGYLSHNVVARFVESRAYPDRGGSFRGYAAREAMHHLPRTSRHQLHQQGFVAFASCGQVDFPKPADRNVNMLPFVFGDKSSLPSDLQCYFKLIQACPYNREGDNKESGRVGYLTVHEGFVKAGEAQRREGLHIETPGGFSEKGSAAFSPGTEHSWGMGRFFEGDKFEGGIYMASNMADTSEVWDALVDKNVAGIVDKHGGCEHLRSFLGPGTKLGANQLIWMTDCTPHEALEQQVDGYRQFFRVVTPCISHWFARHSTANPLVAIPDDVIVVHEDKFEA